MRRSFLNKILDITNIVTRQENLITIIPKEMLIEEEKDSHYEEEKLIKIAELDSLEVEIIKTQGFKEEVATELIYKLKNNILNNRKDTLIYYTDGSVKKSNEGERRSYNIGISLVQINKEKEEVIEQFSARILG